MYKFFSIGFFLLAITGCASTSEENKEVNHNYLSDKGFIDVYLNYAAAEGKYLRSFSKADKQTLAKAIEPLKLYADNGNPIAQYSYGASTYLVNSKPVSLFKAMLKKSSDAGYLPATRKLAQFYRSGQHFGKDISTAINLLETNATYGHARDIKTLLILYKKLPNVGESSSKYKALEAEYELALDFNYHKKRAEAGSLKSQRVYGHLLYHQSIKRKQNSFYNAAYWLSITSSNTLNLQAAYDSSRAIFALNNLTTSEHEKLNVALAKYEKTKL